MTSIGSGDAFLSPAPFMKGLIKFIILSIKVEFSRYPAF